MITRRQSQMVVFRISIVAAFVSVIVAAIFDDESEIVVKIPVNHKVYIQNPEYEKWEKNCNQDRELMNELLRSGGYKQIGDTILGVKLGRSVIDICSMANESKHSHRKRNQGLLKILVWFGVGLFAMIITNGLYSLWCRYVRTLGTLPVNSLI